MQEVLGCFQERLAYSEKPMEDLAGEKEMNALTQLLVQSDEPAEKKKCGGCGKIKFTRDFNTHKKKKISVKLGVETVAVLKLINIRTLK